MLFGRFGDIIYVKIPPGKGCGFVQFVHRPVAEIAMASMQSQVQPSWDCMGCHANDHPMVANNQVHIAAAAAPAWPFRHFALALITVTSMLWLLACAHSPGSLPFRCMSCPHACVQVFHGSAIRISWGRSSSASRGLAGVPSSPAAASAFSRPQGSANLAYPAFHQRQPQQAEYSQRSVAGLAAAQDLYAHLHAAYAAQQAALPLQLAAQRQVGSHSQPSYLLVQHPAFSGHAAVQSRLIMHICQVHLAAVCPLEHPCRARLPAPAAADTQRKPG